MNIIKPKKLKKGDTIGIIAPCGKIDNDKIHNAVKYFETLGYNVKLGKNIKKQLRYLAGSDEERLEDFHYAFLDKEIDAIICARGGYGAIRLINKIDFELIRSNPKIFCGYSDITALSAMILKKSGLITFSAPMAQSDFSCQNINEFTQNSFFNVLTRNTFEIKPETCKVYNPGEAEGISFGGNLATIVSLCGQDFIPDENFIFFAEDLNEPVYKIDKYFTQLLNIKKFRKNLSGIILGDFLDTDEPKFLEEFFTELSKELNIPIIGGFPITHAATKTAVPYGAAARIENETLKFANFTV